MSKKAGRVELESYVQAQVVGPQPPWLHFTRDKSGTKDLPIPEQFCITVASVRVAKIQEADNEGHIHVFHTFKEEPDTPRIVYTIPTGTAAKTMPGTAAERGHSYFIPNVIAGPPSGSHDTLLQLMFTSYVFHDAGSNPVRTSVVRMTRYISNGNVSIIAHEADDHTIRLHVRA